MGGRNVFKFAVKWVYSQIERKIEREILIGKEREIPQKMEPAHIAWWGGWVFKYTTTSTRGVRTPPRANANCCPGRSDPPKG